VENGIIVGTNVDTMNVIKASITNAILCKNIPLAHLFRIEAHTFEQQILNKF
jgi:hypothetical protein